MTAATKAAKKSSSPPKFDYISRSATQATTSKKVGAAVAKSTTVKPTSRVYGAGKATSKKVVAKKATRKPNAAFMKAMTLSPELAAVIGVMAVPRTEITSKLWAYIKKHNLQDPEAKRFVITGDKLNAQLTPTVLQSLGVKLIVPKAGSHSGIGVPKPLKGQSAVKAAREAGIITANGNLTKRYK